ncbi:glucose-6-phosphate dehydrogenase [Microbacterium sp. EF45047]|uniref:glucose-6-phosphate dehydrogenase n=1 Tax=Microbacterium sp. EF45047 TaxID=2809708 RepID=UPI00234B23A0|nr:glucose-6-phosphate dehydrogenase [Microbacterium sp. EF45047]WCM55292.1 glucose-6-phosphate dehydrogenase [Microbacterium sp. EF45047]
MTDETTLVLFGASGDLASRLLLPALGQLLSTEPDRSVRLLGSSTEDWTDADLQRVVDTAFAAAKAESALDRIRVEYVRCDITDAAELAALLERAPDAAALYFAVPPAVTAKACEALNSEMLPPGVMLALEKPFGVDEESARALNERLARIVPENQVFRIDHFLGRSSILNLLGVRFANRRVEPIWSAEHIESVTLVYDEKLGLEGRAGYYDKAGALVDMIQSHLLQLLAVVAMDRPEALDEHDFREATTRVLRDVHVWGDDPVRSSRRARYTAGEIDGAARVDYLEEPGVDPARDTETLAEVDLEVRSDRWRGVPFTLRSGKAMGAKFAEVAVFFRPVEAIPRGFTGSAPGEVMRFTLGPDRMSIEMNVNGPGDPFELDRATLTAELGPGALQAYAEVLAGILDRDATLAVRGDAAEECWRIVAPVLEAWRRGEVPMQEYPAGSRGPADWPSKR